MKCLPAALLLLVLIPINALSAAEPEDEIPERNARPNVLFIAVDDLNDWINCLGGYPGCRTPNIDRLAARGTLFAQAHCAAPACNPSRTALMTGIRPYTSGVYLNSQPWRPVMPNAVTLPQQFMAHGYEALGAGKIYHGGFDDDASWNVYQKKQGDPKPSAKVLADPTSKAGGIIWGRLDVEDSAMEDHRTADFCIAHLSKKHGKPFFLACGIYRPHMPWQVPAKYYDMYPLEEIVLPNVKEDDLADIPAAGRKMAKPEGDHATMLETGNWKHAVQAYLASITFADAEVGRVLDALDAGPHAENTIVVLWGDHGWHLGEKHHWRKFSLWEEATRAPLMIAAPGVGKPGSVCRAPVDFLNIYPTLSDLCSVPLREELEGVSMRPLLENPEAEWKHVAITTHGRGNNAVRSARYRYIRYADGSEELYDHQSDPQEWNNLAAQPELAEVKRELAAWLPKKEAKDAPAGGGGRGARRQNAGQGTD